MTTLRAHDRLGLKLGVLAVVLLLATFSAAQNTPSPNQLTIFSAFTQDAYGQGRPCVSADPTKEYGRPAESRTLTILGKNFLNSGNGPFVYLGAQGPLNVIGTPTDSEVDVVLDCAGLYDIFVGADIDTKGPKFYNSLYRLQVFTGQGQPYYDAIGFAMRLNGPKGGNGSNGKDGVNGHDGVNGKDGVNGNDGINGHDGSNGSNGSNGKDGNNGKNGRGHRVDRVVSTTCPNGGYTLLFYDIDENGVATLVDTKDICHGNNGAQGSKGDQGNQGANGRDGAPGLNGGQGPKGDQGNGGPQGPQGPPGYAYGWHKRFSSAAITGTSTTVLSQVGTGTAAYLIDAKMGAPFANNAKTVTCTLVAVENGVSTTLDSSDTLLLGNSQTTVKHDVSLAGVYTATGGASSKITFNLNCATGGDSRNLSNGRMNIVGVNSLTQ